MLPVAYGSGLAVIPLRRVLVGLKLLFAGNSLICTKLLANRILFVVRSTLVTLPISSGQPELVFSNWDGVVECRLLSSWLEGVNGCLVCFFGS